jgi:hypothetical protein
MCQPIVFYVSMCFNFKFQKIHHQDFFIHFSPAAASPTLSVGTGSAHCLLLTAFLTHY